METGNFEKFLQAYIDCAKRTCYISYDSEDEDFEKDFSGIDLSESAKIQAEKDCKNFIKATKKFGIDISNYVEQTGYDFWLTRNSHGTGFWDRPEVYGKQISQKLTEIAEKFRESNLYLGNDGLAYFE